MCFHTSQTKTVSEIENHYHVELHDDMAREAFDIPAYHLNGFAHPLMFIIPQEEPSKLVLGKWGIAPNNTKLEDLDKYYKKAVKYGGGLNARSEKLFEHFIYKYSVFTKKCIVPVTGFFEPHEHNKKKYPIYIEQKEKMPLSLAGIYTFIEGFATFSILTKPASPLFSKIHNLKKRQPVILKDEFCDQWLRDDLSEKAIEELIGLPYNDNDISSYPVSKNLFSPREDSNIPEILNKHHYNGLEIY